MPAGFFPSRPFPLLFFPAGFFTVVFQTRESADDNFRKAKIGLVSFVLGWFGLVRIGNNWCG